MGWNLCQPPKARAKLFYHEPNISQQFLTTAKLIARTTNPVHIWRGLTVIYSAWSVWQPSVKESNQKNLNIQKRKKHWILAYFQCIYYETSFCQDNAFESSHSCDELGWHLPCNCASTVTASNSQVTTQIVFEKKRKLKTLKLVGRNRTCLALS